MPAPRGALVIGIGNPLRGDDGVGWVLVEELAATTAAAGPSLELLAVHQLTPELAVDLAASEQVLFIDAWAGSIAAGREEEIAAGQPRLRCLSHGWQSRKSLHTGRTAPAADAGSGDRIRGGGDAADRPSPRLAAIRSHHLDPESLLAMTAALYGAAPRAHLLEVPAFAFPFGMDLSPALQARLPQARSLLVRWLRQGSELQGKAAPKPSETGSDTPAESDPDPVGHA